MAAAVFAGEGAAARGGCSAECAGRIDPLWAGGITILLTILPLIYSQLEGVFQRLA